MIGSYYAGSLNNVSYDVIIEFNGTASNAAVEAVLENLQYINPRNAPLLDREISIRMEEGGLDWQSNLSGGGFIYKDIWSDGTYYYAIRQQSGMPDQIAAYSYNGSSFTLLGSYALATTDKMRSVIGDGTYVYTYAGTSHLNPDSTINMLQFNGTSFTLVTTFDAGPGVALKDVIVHNGHLLVSEHGAGGVRALHFDGVSLVEDAHIAGTTGALYSDASYFYMNSGGRLRAYTFDGTTFVEIASILNTWGGVHDIVSDGTYIYTLGDSTVGAFTFNGISFTALGSYSPIDQYGELAVVSPGVIAVSGSGLIEPLKILSFNGATFALESYQDRVWYMAQTHGVFVDGSGRIFHAGTRTNEGIDVYTYTPTTEVATYTRTVTVIAENDSPAGADNTITINEDTVHTFVAANFGFTDPDGPGDSLSAVRIDTLPVNGTLRLSGVAVTAGQIILAADIANLTFTPAPDANGNAYASFTFSVRDQSSAYDPSPNTVTFNVTPVTDLPTVTGWTGSVTFGENTVNAGWVIVDNDVTVTGNGNYGFNIIISTSSGSNEDHISIRNQGTGAGQIGVSGNTITYGGVAIGTLVYGSNDVQSGSYDLVIKLNGTASNAAVEALLENIQYRNTSDNPQASRTLDIRFEQGGLEFVSNFTRTMRDIWSDGTYYYGVSGSLDAYTFDGTNLSLVSSIGIWPAMSPDRVVGDGTYIYAVGAEGIRAYTFNGTSFTLLDTHTASGVANVYARDGFIFIARTDGNIEALTFNGADFTSVDVEPLSGAGKSIWSDGTYYYVSTAAGMQAFTFNGSSFTLVGSYAVAMAGNWTGMDGADGYIYVATGGPYLRAFTFNGTTFTQVGVLFDSVGQAIFDVQVKDGKIYTAIAGSGLEVLTFNGTTFAIESRQDGHEGHSAVYVSSNNTVFLANWGAQSAVYRYTAVAELATLQTTINVTAENDAPTGADNTITINEDASHTFTAANFGFSDVDTGDSLSAVRIDTLPANGTLRLSGVAVTAGQVITAAQLANLTFTPVADGNGNAYASFTFSVRDQASAYDASPNTITFNVTPVNDAPTGSDNTITFDQNTSHTFAAADFGFGDVDAGDSLSAVRIGTLPAAGTFQLNGVDVTAGQVILAADIANLVFTPAPNAGGDDYASFTFSVRDQAGAYDAAPNTITFDVTITNVAPEGADNTVTIDEDTSHTFAAADFGFSDADIGDTLSAVRIDSLPLNGTLRLNGVDVVAGQVILTADIVNLVFAPAANANGNAYASLTFSVRDQAGTYDVAPNTITFDVTPVNDAPTGADDTITINEDGSHTFAATDFGFSDIDAGDSLSAVRIDTLPVNGTLRLNGVDVVAGQVILAADIANLVFAPAANANGNAYASLTFSVRDQAGAYDVAPNTITFDVTPVNDAPTGADDTIVIDEDTSHTFAAADFGFSDIDVGDSLSAVRIDTLPLNGTLRLNGVDVVAGQVILTADIANLVFAPAADANGNAYASFTFSVRDQAGAYDAASNTITFDVTPVNDAPTGADDTIVIDEDTSHTFAAADFGFSDVDVGDSLSAVRIDTLPVNGTLRLNGVDVVAGQVILTADVANLVFAPAANANGNAYASLTFSVRDQAGAYDVAPNTMTFDVTSVNDAPMGADDTITMLESTAYTFAVADFGFSDVDIGDSLSAVRIDTLPAAGTFQLNGVDVVAGQVILAADIANLVFTPDFNTNGNDYAVFTFSVRDQAGAYDAAPNTITIDVVEQNDAPEGADDTIVIDEDTSHTFAVADFGFSDIDAGDSLSAVRIDTLPVNGTLRLNGVDVIAGQVILAADIADLVYAPVTDANGVGYTSFTFSVRDQLGAYDVTPNTITFDVTPVNDAPTGADDTITINEDGSHTFAAADFGFSDIDVGDSLSAVRIDALPVNGTLRLNGVDVVAGQVILTADIANLVFAPAPDANGNAYASFTFSVRDQAGAYDVAPNTITFDVTPVNDAPAGADDTIVIDEDTSHTFAAADFGFSDIDVGDSLSAVRIDTLPLNGTLRLNGVDVVAGQVILAADIANLVFAPAANANGNAYASLTFSVRDQAGAYDAAPNTITFDVTPVNDAPTGADDTITINEDGSHAFAAADFGFSDIDTGDSLSAVRIDSLPLNGTLRLNGVDVVAGQVILTADIANLVFAPAANANGNAYASLTFSVRDQAGTYDAAPNTITFDVTPVNDAPTGADDTIVIDEDTSHTFAAADFGFSDIDVGDALSAVRIDALPANGTLRLNGVDLVAGQVILTADIANLVFAPAANANGNAYASLTFSVRDQAGAYDVAPKTITFDVTPVNDAPTGADNTITINEDASHTFAAANFGFSDIDAGDSLSAVRIDTLPVNGTLRLNGVDVVVGQVILAADIGNLVFAPAANANGNAYASLTFSVRDQAGAYDTAPNTMTFDVTPVNDAPTGADNTITINEDTGHTFAAADFGFSDVDAGDSLSAVRINTLPAGATLQLNGVNVTAGQIILAADIANLVFTPAANANGNAYASFSFSVRDQAGAYDVAPNTLTFDVTPVNDAPTGSDVTMSLLENTSHTFAPAEFGFSDVDAGDSMSAVRIDVLPVNGTLMLNGVAVNAGDMIMMADIGNLVYTPVPDANGLAYAWLGFSVRDQAGAFALSSNTLTIDVMKDGPTVGEDLMERPPLEENKPAPAPARGIGGLPDTGAPFVPIVSSMLFPESDRGTAFGRGELDEDAFAFYSRMQWMPGNITYERVQVGTPRLIGIDDLYRANINGDDAVVIAVRLFDGTDAPQWIEVNADGLMVSPPEGVVDIIDLIVVVTVNGEEVMIPLRLDVTKDAIDAATTMSFSEQLVRQSQYQLSREVELEVRRLLGE